MSLSGGGIQGAKRNRKAGPVRAAGSAERGSAEEELRMFDTKITRVFNPLY